MQIRQANLNDASALSHLLAKVWRVAYRGIFPQDFLDNIQDDGWTEGFKQGLSNPQATTLVAEIDRRIVAMIAFGKGREENQAENEIYALNVLPEFQGQKIGSALMKCAFAQLGESGIYLKVAVKNYTAQRFYAKHGFHNSQQIQTRQIADFRFDEWIFQREK